VASSRALEHAVQIALARHGRIRVDAMAESAGIGVRQLERQFIEAVGLSPKAFIRTARLQRALRLLRGDEPPAGVAEACGFADQAHLAPEVRSVAGVPAREVRFGGLAFLSDPSQQAGIG
jgi:transcriptional regulator GlxA family with amidase domain